MNVALRFVMQRLALYQRVREQQSAERFVAQHAHGRPCAAQVFGNERTVREAGTHFVHFEVSAALLDAMRK